MYTIIKIIEAFSLISSGIFSGAALYITLVEHPARLDCGTLLALTQWKPSYIRATYMQVTLALLAFIFSVVAWLLNQNIWWLIGGLIFISVVPYTLIFMFPINKRLLLLLSSGVTEKDHKELLPILIKWGRFHLARVMLSFIALFIFLVQF